MLASPPSAPDSLGAEGERSWVHQSSRVSRQARWFSYWTLLHLSTNWSSEPPFDSNWKYEHDIGLSYKSVKMLPNTTIQTNTIDHSSFREGSSLLLNLPIHFAFSRLNPQNNTCMCHWKGDLDSPSTSLPLHTIGLERASFLNPPLASFWQEPNFILVIELQWIHGDPFPLHAFILTSISIWIHC